MPQETLPDTAEPSSQAGLPVWAKVLDATAVLLLLGMLAAAARGGFHVDLFGLRISARSPDRILWLAGLLLVARHWRIRHPTIWQRIEQFLRRSPVSSGVDAQLAAAGARSLKRRLVELALVSAFFAAIVAAATYPQIVRLDSVPDLGDPLFSTWRLAWVAHQLPRDPLHLFDANIFHPERLTLTYSDSTIVPALMAAPFFWLGVHPLYVYNLLLLFSLAFSGFSMFVLVRALTGRPEPGLVAGTIFALYPYRWEHYSHLELHVTFWMPFLLLAVHYLFARGGRRYGILAGVLVALQALSSMYYGLFLTVYLVPIVIVLVVQSHVRRRAVSSLAIGMIVAGVLVAPIAAPYVANRSVVGERPIEEVRLYSASSQDYLRPHPRSRYYGLWDSGPRRAERELFPSVSPAVLALIGLYPPFSAARIGYAGALAISFEASLGLNSRLYRVLRTYGPPFRGLRVPARFSILVGLSLAILAGFGAARLLRFRQRLPRVLATAAMIGIALWELWPTLGLQPVWLHPPGIYKSLQGKSGVVLAEFPMPGFWPDDPRATYFSVFHWHRIVNGISGHYPPSYMRLLATMRKEFPSAAAVEYLRERGVTHIVVHGAYYEPDRYGEVARALAHRSDVAFVTRARFDRGESLLYELRR